MAAVDDDARRLLERRRIAVKTIVRVDPDSILFVDANDAVFTAWIRSPVGRMLQVIVEPGMPAERGVLFADEIPTPAPESSETVG